MTKNDNEIQILINLYNERSQLANQHTNLYMDEIKLYFTLIIATFTIPFALKRLGYERLGYDNESVLIIFPIIGIFFCIAGIWSLVREMTAFQNALFAVSKIREELSKYCPTFMKNIDNNFESIGIIPHVDFKQSPNQTLKSFIKHRLRRRKSNVFLLSLIYIVFIFIHILLFFLFLLY